MPLDLPEPKTRKPTLRPYFSSRKTDLSYRDRLDPMHEMTWKEGINVEWERIGGWRRQLAMSARGQIVHERVRVSSEIRVPKSDLFIKEAILVVANLIHYYQLTTTQLATVIGSSPRSVDQACKKLFSAGILERAKPTWEIHAESGRPLEEGSRLWRIVYRADSFKKWLAELTPIEALSIGAVSHEFKSTASSQTAGTLRHNLIAAETMIRAMECVPGVAGIWGERFTSARGFLTQSGMTMESIRSNIADGAIVTRDGQIILIEVSGASTVEGPNAKRIQNKAAAWAAICALSDMPIRVVFLDVSEKPSTVRFRWHVQKGSEGVSKFLPNKFQREKGRACIFVASAQDWFPLPLTISEGFRTLESWSPIDGRYHDLVSTETSWSNVDHVVNTIAGFQTPNWILENVA